VLVRSGDWTAAPLHVEGKVIYKQKVEKKVLKKDLA
jgi:hypothetical protein